MRRMKIPVPLTALALLLSGCATLSPAPYAPPAAPAPAERAEAAAAPGMVSAADPRAAEAGAEMLRAGGSAADAAIATMIALTVVEPGSSGIGGGGFLVYRDAAGRMVTYNGRETAPAAADGTWFFKDGQPLSVAKAIPGGRSVGVPGNIRLAALAHKEQGRLPWAKLFEPAIRLARDGFVMTPLRYRALGDIEDMGAYSPESRAIFYGPDGKAKPVGTRITNPALADFLQRIAKNGPDEFYRGDNARRIVAAVNGARDNPSRMTEADVAAFRAERFEPVCGEYRRHRICGMGPPSSGATTVFAILKQLERFDMAALGPRSATAWHLIGESSRLAYADRDQYIGDGNFVSVPVRGLMDEAYLASRSALISPDKSLNGVAAGRPPGAKLSFAKMADQPEYGTSHFAAADRWGAVASYTSTIESGFGSGLMVNGYHLNNELTDFSIMPTGADGKPVANRVQGGKRPRSSMSPTIVYAPDGSVRMAVGAAGGPTIIAQVAKAIIGVIDWNLSAQDAIALPVIYAPAGDTVYVERGTWLEGMIPQLAALGQRVEARPPGFKANAIEYKDGRWHGAADPRSEGAAVSQ